MSDVHDMTSQMAKELMQGIRDNVRISRKLKKMAIINRIVEKQTCSRPVEEAMEASAEQPSRVSGIHGTIRPRPEFCGAGTRS